MRDDNRRWLFVEELKRFEAKIKKLTEQAKPSKPDPYYPRHASVKK